MIDIRMSNGMQIRQKNLDFGRLKKLVENLEAYAEHQRTTTILVYT